MTNISNFLDFDAQALRLRGQRAQVLASNLANADTPGYQARDFDFKSALGAATGMQSGTTVPAVATALTAARTDSRHLAAATGTAAGPDLQYRQPMQTALDGNTVEPDVERAQFMDNSLRFESGLRFMSANIKTLMTAITGT